MRKRIEIVEGPDFTVFENSGYAGVEYDYSRDSCGCTGAEGDGCDGYGRCSTITSTRITKVDPVAIAKEVAKKIADPFTRYCVERVVIHSGVRDFENWECRVGGGYYGEEVYGVELDYSTKAKVEEAVNAVYNASTNTEKIHLALQAEYGYILPAIEQFENWEIRNVSRDAVKVPQNDHYRRLDGKIIGWYEGYEGPVGVAYADRPGWRLVDGYHRFFVSKGQDTIPLIVGF